MGFVIGNVSDVYPFEELVGLGYLPNVISEFKFGYNPDLALTTLEDVWDFGGLYTYSTTADIDKISSSSTADNQDVLVFGLDANYDLTILEVTLNGQNKVSLGTSLIRLHRIKNVGSTDFAGAVYAYVDGTISGGIPTVATTIRGYVVDGNNQTLMLMYTIPNGYTGIIRGSSIFVGGRKSGFVTVKYWVRPFGSVFQVKDVIDLATTGTSAYQSLFDLPLGLKGKSDLKVNALGSTVNLTVGGTIDIYLFKDV